MLQHTLHWG
jgi:hypothetical protein